MTKSSSKNFYLDEIQDKHCFPVRHNQRFKLKFHWKSNGNLRWRFHEQFENCIVRLAKRKADREFFQRPKLDQKYVDRCHSMWFDRWTSLKRKFSLVEYLISTKWIQELPRGISKRPFTFAKISRTTVSKKGRTIIERKTRTMNCWREKKRKRKTAASRRFLSRTSFICHCDDLIIQRLWQDEAEETFDVDYRNIDRYIFLPTDRSKANKTRHWAIDCHTHLH